MAKKLGVIAVSLMLGAVLTWIIIWRIPTTPAIYGPIYFALTAIFLAGIFAIWIDHFTNAGILPR